MGDINGPDRGQTPVQKIAAASTAEALDFDGDGELTLDDADHLAQRMKGDPAKAQTALIKRFRELCPKGISRQDCVQRRKELAHSVRYAGLVIGPPAKQDEGVVLDEAEARRSIALLTAALELEPNHIVTRDYLAYSLFQLATRVLTRSDKETAGTLPLPERMALLKEARRQMRTNEEQIGLTPRTAEERIVLCNTQKLMLRAVAHMVKLPYSAEELARYRIDLVHYRTYQESGGCRILFPK